jgi:nucleoid DNA-binding protein
MTRLELIERIYSRYFGKFPKKTIEACVDSFFNTIKNSLIKGQRVEIRNFGSFEVRTYKARGARDPRTGEKIQIPGKKLPRWRTGRGLKEEINKL